MHPTAIAVTDLVPFDQVTLAATPLIVGRVTAPFRDVHGVERVLVCGINAVTGRNTAIPAAVDTAAVVS